MPREVNIAKAVGLGSRTVMQATAGTTGVDRAWSAVSNRVANLLRNASSPQQRARIERVSARLKERLKNYE